MGIFVFHFVFLDDVLNVCERVVFHFDNDFLAHSNLLEDEIGWPLNRFVASGDLELNSVFVHGGYHCFNSCKGF